MAGTSYIFQIEFLETERMPSSALAEEKLSALVIAVRLGNAEPSVGERGDAERAAAEAVAQAAAAEALGSLICQGRVPGYAISQLDQLPEHLQKREPDLRKNGLSLWLITGSPP